MEEITPPVPQPSLPPQKPKLSKEERSKVMRDAATRRWAKARTTATAAVKAAHTRPPARALVVKKRSAPPREFSSALKMAEKRLAKAIQERAEAAAKYAVLTAEIPSLGRLIIALRNPFGIVPGTQAMPEINLEQIVGDQPLQYQNPPRPAPAVVPPMQHPVTTQSRAMGGAIGVELAEDDEDKFLKDSGVATGNWH